MRLVFLVTFVLGLFSNAYANTPQQFAPWSGGMDAESFSAFIRKNFDEPKRSELLEKLNKKDPQASSQYILAEELGFVDDITINGRAFESLEQREIQFYPEDLQDGKVIVEGLLESLDKAVSVDSLFVEITVDGGETWSRAIGQEEWEWSFEPKLEQIYEFSLRVVRLDNASQSPFEEYESPQVLPDPVYVAGFTLHPSDNVSMQRNIINGTGVLHVPYLSTFGLSNELPIDIQNIRIDENRVIEGSITYDSPLVLDHDLLRVNIESLEFSAGGVSFDASVTFKGVLEFLGTINVSDTSTILPDGIQFDIPIQATQIPIWDEYGVNLRIADGLISFAYALGDDAPRVSTSGLESILDMGTFLRGSYAGNPVQVDFDLNLNPGELSEISFLGNPSVYLFGSHFALEGLNGFFDFSTKRIDLSASVNLDGYEDPFFSALTGALTSISVLENRFEGSVQMDGGFPPVVLLDRGGPGRDVVLNVQGTPSFEIVVNNADVSFDFGELSAQVDFGDILQSSANPGALRSVSASIQQVRNAAQQYRLEFSNDANAYLLGSQVHLLDMVGVLDMLNKSIHIESRTDLSGYDDVLLRALDNIFFIADISPMGIEASLSVGEDMDPVVILDRGSVNKSVRFAFTEAPIIDLSIIGDSVDFSIERGDARLYFGELMEGAQVDLRLARNNVYQWQLNTRKKLLNGEKIDLSRMQGDLDFSREDISVCFSADVSMNRYGGMFASIRNLRAENICIDEDGLSGSVIAMLDPIDIYPQKNVVLTFLDEPTVNFTLQGDDFDVAFTNLDAQIDFGDIFENTIARIQRANSSVVRGKPGVRGINVNSQGALSWSVQGVKNLHGSDVAFNGLHGLLDISEPENPRISINAFVDLSGYSALFSTLRNVALQDGFISRDGFEGILTANLQNIDIWPQKNVSIIFDPARPLQLSLAVNAQGFDFGIVDMQASLSFGTLFNGAVAQMRTLGNGLHAWNIDGRFRLDRSRIYMQELFGALDLSDLQAPKIALNANVDISQYSPLFKNIRSIRLQDGLISYEGFSGEMSFTLDNLDIWSRKDVSIAFASDPRLSLKVDGAGFDLAMVEIDANIDFGQLLDGEIVRLSNSAARSVGSIRDRVVNVRNLANPGDILPKLPVSNCVMYWDLQQPHNLIRDENGLVTVTQIGGKLDMCDVSDPVITFDATADFTQYEFELGNLGVATVDDATISKRGIDWNELGIEGASTEFTILDLGTQEEDVWVELFNIDGRVNQNGSAEVERGDGTLYFGALFEGDDDYVNLHYVNTGTYSFDTPKEFSYQNGNESVVLRGISGVVQRRGDTYYVTINGQAIVQAGILSSINVNSLAFSGLTIDSQGFRGTISARGINQNINLLNGKAMLDLERIDVRIDTAARIPISLVRFDGFLDLSAVFDESGRLAKAALSIQNSIVTWSFANTLHINQFLFKNLSGQLSFDRLNAPSISINGLFGIENFSQIELALNDFVIDRSGIRGYLGLGGGTSIPIAGIEGLSITEFGIDFGPMISGNITLDYTKERFLGSADRLHVNMSALIDAEGVQEFSIDADSLRNISIEGFANLAFTDVSINPNLDNFRISLDGTIRPAHDVFSARTSVEFEDLTIDRRGVSVGQAGVMRDVSGASGSLGGLSLGLERLGLGFSGNALYIAVEGGLSLEITEAAAGLRLYSDGRLEVDRVRVLVNQPALTVAGDVQWYQDDRVYGNGFSATNLQLTIAGLFSVKGDFRIGDKRGKGFYWMGAAQGGVGGAGIPLGPLTIYELGGGVASNMTINIDDQNRATIIPSGQNNYIIMISSLLGTSDQGFTWHGQVGFNFDTAGQIVIEGRTYLLDTLHAKPADRRIDGRIVIGMSPASLHITGDARVYYSGLGVIGSSDIMLSSHEKHVYIGTYAGVQGFNVSRNLGPVEGDIFGLRPWAYFMIDTRRLAFGGGFDFDERYSIDVCCSPDPYVRFEAFAEAHALLQYNPLFLDMMARMGMGLYFGYGDLFEGGLGADVSLRFRAPDPTYLKARITVDIPIYGDASFTGYFPKRPRGGSSSDNYPGLINHFEPYDTDAISLMPTFKVVSTFDVDGSTFEFGDMTASGDHRGGQFTVTTPVGFTASIDNLSLVHIASGRGIAFDREVDSNEISLIPRTLLRAGERYRISGLATLTRSTEVSSAPAGSMDELIELAGDPDAYMEENGSPISNRNEIVKSEEFTQEFTVKEERRLEFGEIVRSIYPENLQNNVHENESVTIFYDPIVNNVGINNELIRNYQVQVIGADDVPISGQFSFEYDAQRPRSVFQPDQAMRVYYFCQNDLTGEVRETIKNADGEYLNPFKGYSVDGEFSEEDVDVEGGNSAIPGYIRKGNIEVKSLGNHVKTVDERYSYYTNNEYGMLITDTSTNQIVHYSTFNIRDNDSGNESVRHFEALFEDLNPSLEYKRCLNRDYEITVILDDDLRSIGAAGNSYDENGGRGIGCRVETMLMTQEEGEVPENIIHTLHKCIRPSDSGIINLADQTDNIMGIQWSRVVYYNIETGEEYHTVELPVSEGGGYVAGMDDVANVVEGSDRRYMHGPRPEEVMNVMENVSQGVQVGQGMRDAAQQMNQGAQR